jgi:hypothetical protein
MKEIFEPIYLKHELVQYDKKLTVIIKKMDEMGTQLIKWMNGTKKRQKAEDREHEDTMI